MIRFDLRLFKFFTDVKLIRIFVISKFFLVKFRKFFYPYCFTIKPNRILENLDLIPKLDKLLSHPHEIAYCMVWKCGANLYMITLFRFAENLATAPARNKLTSRIVVDLEMISCFLGSIPNYLFRCHCLKFLLPNKTLVIQNLERYRLANTAPSELRLGVRKPLRGDRRQRGSFF